MSLKKTLQRLSINRATQREKQVPENFIQIYSALPYEILNILNRVAEYRSNALYRAL